MKKNIKKINKIAKKYPESIELFHPVDFKMMLRCENRLTSSFDIQLKEFYSFSNGARIMDYSFAGCKNNKIADITEITLDTWALSLPNITLNFQNFMKNSIGENFGLLEKTKDSNGNYVVAYQREITSDNILIVSSSLEKFLDLFFDYIEDTLFEDKNSLLINQKEWILDLDSWFEFDLELVRLYKSGTLSGYYESNNEYKKIVEKALHKY